MERYLLRQKITRLTRILFMVAVDMHKARAKALATLKLNYPFADAAE
jgi:hypothetical protein